MDDAEDLRRLAEALLDELAGMPAVRQGLPFTVDYLLGRIGAALLTAGGGATPGTIISVRGRRALQPDRR